ncbi:SDR family oxidoreductase [Actinoplanes sp. CA-015351]|uniref:SDR family oxidoreductase n=1 Tax=Actinoplanes sp. CA-015351 TaxID=3239897 RepID=UPI003D993836
MRFAVAGGTGLIGRLVVEQARAAGHHVVIISRSSGVDLTTGAGLDDALREVGAVIDVTNVVTLKRDVSVRFFEQVTRTLNEGEKRAGVAHHVVLSIVGVDRVEFGYYQGKLRQEELALSSGVPATVLRATQFFEFAGQQLSNLGGPLAVVPKMRTQPVAAAEVATELVRLAEGPALGLAPDIAGPQILEMSAMARRVSRAHGPRKLVLGIPLPGAAGKAMRTGALIPTAAGPRGTTTFDEWLAKRP